MSSNILEEKCKIEFLYLFEGGGKAFVCFYKDQLI